ncbi:unnamed protein product (macronuclear) [Paramecium tetraurelia]|uniref:Protein kinase domain-containing protein n=1 Tax=Paramecium tetraurelia TaxID=5888 RepID=A0CDG6_PARTE|nr:uncharacterized protein GSPATT00007044001 [Paramecium tetraurelia]CAK68833.1 unnamed protein product [Paramecium tetraurelia]|eukprot:XP_001436230.1 hypothetical protein (macronuclear) [Paramecium tetraurelia strain d4-2]
MNEALKTIVKFLEHSGLQQSARKLKEEIIMMKNEIDCEKKQQQMLMKIICQALDSKKKEKKKPIIDRQAVRRKPKVFTQEQTEQIMEKFMNRLVSKPNLLEDETLNEKIERYFDNATFQKMVDQADVFHDISNTSISNSILKKKRTETSEEQQQAPCFGNCNKYKIQENDQIVFGKIQQPQKHQKQQVLEKSPSVDELFTEEDVSRSAARHQQFEDLKVDATIPLSFYKTLSRLYYMIWKKIKISQMNIMMMTILDLNSMKLENRISLKRLKNWAEKFGFPQRAMAQLKQKKDEVNCDDEDDSGVLLKSQQKSQEESRKGYIYLPPTMKHPESTDDFYPVEFDRVIYDCFNLKVIFDRERTGFEETKDFPIVINSIIAGRYQILEYLGSAAFSKAVKCLDLQSQKEVCMKIIENNKDYMDQSIDEIKLLKYINCNGDCDAKNVLKLYDFFYHKEHLFLVTELLKDNLYEFYKYYKETEKVNYFTVGRLQKLTKQILIALDYVHSLKLIHCDLKPENILMRSISKCECKVIDFGSSCFIHDHLSSYVQSRSYRAPEVIIGCKYDYKIDMWSLGCILAELWTGFVLFQNDTVQGLLARVIGIIGPFPEYMMKEGRLVNQFFTKEKLLYQNAMEDQQHHQNSGLIQILVPKKSNLKARLKTDDMFFLDFVKQLLHIDPSKRPSAKDALNHPWFTQIQYPDGL